MHFMTDHEVLETLSVTSIAFIHFSCSLPILFYRLLHFFALISKFYIWLMFIDAAHCWMFPLETKILLVTQLSWIFIFLLYLIIFFFPIYRLDIKKYVKVSIIKPTTSLYPYNNPFITIDQLLIMILTK